MARTCSTNRSHSVENILTVFSLTRVYRNGEKCSLQYDIKDL